MPAAGTPVTRQHERYQQQTHAVRRIANAPLGTDDTHARRHIRQQRQQGALDRQRRSQRQPQIRGTRARNRRKQHRTGNTDKHRIQSKSMPADHHANRQSQNKAARIGWQQRIEAAQNRNTRGSAQKKHLCRRRRRSPWLHATRGGGKSERVTMQRDATAAHDRTQQTIIITTSSDIRGQTSHVKQTLPSSTSPDNNTERTVHATRRT